MEEELDLVRVLKGHEGETFYEVRSNIGREVVYEGLDEYGTFLVFRVGDKDGVRTYVGKGNWRSSFAFLKTSGLAPSRRDFYKWCHDPIKAWGEWDLAHNPRPKTWDQLETEYRHLINKSIYAEIKYKENIPDLTPIQKSCLALLKLNQLIEFGYGGNPTNTELCLNTTYCINSDFHISTMCDLDRKQMVCFHNKYQAEEFLKYRGNRELLVEYHNREVSWG